MKSLSRYVYVWPFVGLLVAFPYLPVHVIVSWQDWEISRVLAVGLGATLSLLGVVWYVERCATTRPSNPANRWLGFPALIVAAGFAVGGAMAFKIAILSATMVPLIHGMLYGGRQPVVVEVATNVVGALPRRRGACRNWLYLTESKGPFRQYICFDSAEVKAIVEQRRPSSPVALTGWGNDRAIIYWSAKPHDGPVLTAILSQ